MAQDKRSPDFHSLSRNFFFEKTNKAKVGKKFKNIVVISSDT